MAEIVRSGQLLEIDGKVRIEHGPVRVTAVATAELLDNLVTAEHYAEGAIDADGHPIQIGSEFTYVDWLKTAKPEGIFYLFRLEDLTPEECAVRGCSIGETIWREIGTYDTEEAALAVGLDLLGG